MWKSAGRAPSLRVLHEFALELRKKHGKTSISVRKTAEYSIHITKTPTHYKTHTNTHTHILQNNIKPPQYKLKQTQCKLYPNETFTV
jgi:hypothetical protein